MQINELALRVFIKVLINKLALINKVFSNKNKLSVTELYKAFVRPILEYGTIIWSPYTSTNIIKLERVQKRMCRMIPELYSSYNCTYSEQLNALGLFSLQAHRLRFQLISIFKIYNGFTKINFDDLFERNKIFFYQNS